VVLRHDVKFFDEDELSSEDNKQIVDDFKQGVLNLCQENMGKFFRDKNLHTGGKIPNSLLSNKRRISMVLNYTKNDGITHAFSAIEKFNPNWTYSEKGEISKDTILIVEILNELSSSGVPEQFAGGMLCLYLELIEGIIF
jgi:hypothetical protein